MIEALALRSPPYRNPGRLALLANSQDWEDGALLEQDFRVPALGPVTFAGVAMLG